MGYWNNYKDVPFKTLVGKTIVSVSGDVGDKSLVFEDIEGNMYMMSHYQDCCESVTVEDICGDWSDIIGQEIIFAEEAVSHDNPDDADEDLIKYQESYTWTFYKIDTQRGGVTIRWYGSSNGYYSESVNFEMKTHDGEVH